MDMKGFLTKKNIIIMASAALAVALVVTLIILLGGAEPKEPEVTYEMYEFQMTPDERRAFYNTFESFDAFAEWYYAGKEAYEAEKGDGPVLGDDGVIDLGGK